MSRSEKTYLLRPGKLKKKFIYVIPFADMVKGTGDPELKSQELNYKGWKIYRKKREKNKI